MGRWIIETGDGGTVGASSEVPIVLEADTPNAAVDALRRWVTKLKLRELHGDQYRCPVCKCGISFEEAVCSSACAYQLERAPR